MSIRLHVAGLLILAGLLLAGQPARSAETDILPGLQEILDRDKLVVATIKRDFRPIVFTALVAMTNWLLGGLLGEWTGLNAFITSASGGRYDSLSLQLLFGLVGAPLAWLMGIDSSHLMVSGQLLGEKTVLNEFIAYLSMSKLQASGALTDDRTRIILTYALCGFSNIVSIGIQIGGIGALAPEKRPELARLGWRALLGGSLACFLTACIAGMMT